MSKKMKNMKKRHKRELKRIRKEESESAVVKKQKEEMKKKDELIAELQHEKLILEENAAEMEDVQESAPFHKAGKKYPTNTRMFVYDCIMNNVPTGNIPVLMQQFAKRSSTPLEDVPQRSTVEFMARELGVVSDVIAAEILITDEDLTLGFDATTQEGIHVNSIHFTSKGKCYVLAIDQLPGGTPEDYESHITETVDHLSEMYCKEYNTDFDTTRDKIISHQIL